MALPLPSRVGKYELQEFLGGGMSHVYRAEDKVLGRTVALKLLTEAGNSDPDVKARFLLEARMAGNVDHENIISVYDFGTEQGRPYLVMEFLRGESLREAIKSGRSGDLKSKLRIALQIGRALEYVHARKIIHRDIKPENIHVDPAGKVKLMDFGIAKTEGFALTRAGFTLGTPYYMPPEQVLGQEVTHLVDVYAFGILLFELLSGSKPIAADSIERIFHHILNEPLNMEPLQGIGVPQPIYDLISRCTAKKPEERYQNFTLICEALLAALDGRRQKPRPAPSRVDTVELGTGEIRLPALIGRLPPQFHTQAWVMALVAIAILGGFGVIVLVVRLVMLVF